MEFTYSNIQVLRRVTFLLVAVTIIGLLGTTVFLAPTGAWYIPAGTLFGLVSVSLWVKAQDNVQVGAKACTTNCCS